MGTRELLVVGCSHRTTPLEVRETLVLEPDQIREALRLAKGERVLHEAMILSTCNRTEFYSLTPDPSGAEAYVRGLISRLKGADLLDAGAHGYAYRDREMVRHLFRVAAGLDSLMLGEMQILGQVKDAYDLACEGGSAGLFLNRLLASALRSGKRARAETEIAKGAVSYASAAVAIATKVYSDLSDKRILLIGAGEFGRIAARHFAEQHPAALLIANRTPERARAIAETLGGETVPFTDFHEALVRADVVVCATRSPNAVIQAEMVRRAMRERPSRPLVLVDLAMPRDVDPAAARLDNVFVYALEALKTIVDQNLSRRRREVPRVEAIVDQEVERFFQWVRSLEVTPIVRELREKFEDLGTEEVERHLRLFPDADRAGLEALARALVNKFLHHPTTRIKQLDLDSDDGLVRLDAVRELFDLHATPEEAPEPARPGEDRILGRRRSEERR